ncbi:MAG: YfhO family protein [Elusimicrobiota bacterium]|jgi:uncharacterized membrane protein YfhO|nr:YfhO family protein [Elusimicrobiota bacterium]
MSFIETIEKNLNLDDKKTFFTVFTIIFTLMVFIVFSAFFFNGRSLVYYGDGIEQDVVTLAYFGQYLRSIIFNFAHGNFTIPMYDHNIGFGMDIISTLHIYVMGDPLTLLSVFAPAKFVEILYDFLILLRFYLAGAFFALYCFKMKRRGFPILFGSFAYVFCGYNLVAFMHTWFLIPVVLLPLLLLSVEKIFDGEKPYLFIIMIFISFTSSFYYSYLLSILIFIYAAIRVFFIFPKNKIKNAFKYLLKFSGYYLIGLLAAGFIFAPNVIAMFDSPRSSVEHAPYLFYTSGYYKLFLFSFITIFHNFIYDYFYHLKLGYPILAMFAVLLIFVKRKEFAQLKILFIFFILTAAFPIAGKIFNGFSYITNRWIFAFSFLVAYIIVAALPKIIKLNKKEFLAMLIFTLCYLAAFAALRSSLSIYVLELRFSFIFLGLCLLVLFILYKKPPSEFKAYISLFVLLLANIAFNANFLYSSKGWDYSSLYLKQGSAYNTLTNNAQTFAKQLENADFARFEQNSFNGESIIENATMLNRVKGMSYYFSLNNPFIYQYFKEMGIASERDFRYTGLDGRAMTGTLANSHYFIAALGNEAYAPYGYEAMSGSYRAYNKTIYTAYQNKNALPFGYTYSHYLPRSIYDDFSSIRKQQVQTQSVILEENLPSDWSLLNEPAFREIPIFFQAKASSNISVYGNIFTIAQQSGVISFDFKSLPNSETYLTIKNIKLLTPYNPEEYLYIRSPRTIKTVPLLGVWSPWYIDRSDFIINAGFNADAITQMLLVFNPNSRFSIDNMEIVSLPIGAEFDAEIDRLKQEHLQNVQILTNKIKGNINLSSNKILLLSIPYTKGWKAFVNGKETKLLRANTIFSALPLKAGAYDIELRYRTPGIILGLLLSCIGFLLFAALLYAGKKKNK